MDNWWRYDRNSKLISLELFVNLQITNSFLILISSTVIIVGVFLIIFQDHIWDHLNILVRAKNVDSWWKYDRTMPLQFVLVVLVEL